MRIPVAFPLALLLSPVVAFNFVQISVGSKAWKWYKASLTSHPLLTKTATTAVIMVVSDFACQRLEVSMNQSLADSRDLSGNLQKGYPAYFRSPDSEGRTRPFFFHHDWLRTRDVAITGLAWSGPLGHFWYAVLESVVTVKHRLLGIVVRLLMDTFLFSPFAGEYR
jgi:hypothetical protein